ncbi:hypothetical protein [Bdellovibrio sp. HCB337]|uniref:hypothetical protein n=1 Tax=Bdellovibrio sp. HCB337 TaxID=3394358 RepID=UPI0039A5AFA6
MKFVGLLVLASCILGSFRAQALQSTALLPEGINSPSFRFGSIQGIDERYIENGTLMKLGDYKSVVFDAPTLAKFNQDAKKLINALNRFGSHNLGDEFNLGVLKVDTLPNVKYFAPVFARGITANWTLGMGVPVVTYTNKIRLSQQFSNVEFYRRQFGGLDPELDQALNTDLAVETQKALKDKGYEELGDKNQTFIGDVQIVSMHRLFETADNALVYQAQFSLPTGPKYNPDDLAALNVFGRAAVTNSVVYSHKLSTSFTAVPYASYMIPLQDDISMRVPTSADDTLPDAESKETVHRKIGNTATLGSSLIYDFSDSFSVGAGYEAYQKAKDTFTGGKGSRYDLLSANTALSARKAKLEITYSSVKSYFRKTALLPMIMALEISDVVAGVNVERQLTQELNLMLFF